MRAKCVLLMQVVYGAVLLGGVVEAQVRPVNDDTLRIGVLLPDDDAALPGVLLGAAEAKHAAALFGSAFELHRASSAAAAPDLVERHRVQVIIGGADAAATKVIAVHANDAGVLFMNVGTPPDALPRRCESLTFHLHPSDASRRAALAASGLPPADARVLLWHPSLVRYGAGQVIDRFERAYSIPMTERAYAGWLAVKIAFDAAQRARTTDPRTLSVHLTSPRAVFDGHKGVQLTFRPGTHELRQPLYVAIDDEVMAEVPGSRDAGDRTPAELLDEVLAPGGDPCTE